MTAQARAHGRQLAQALAEALEALGELRPHPKGVTCERLPIVSFGIGSLRAHSIAAFLCNRYNIMVRSGVHCAEPLVRHFGENGLVRISLHLYNTLDEVAYIAECLRSFCSYVL